MGKPESIILIHGWDYQDYNILNNDDVWKQYSDFIDALGKCFNLYKFKIPGFGGNPEPSNSIWSLNDFSKALNDYINTLPTYPDYILGYSFGGAVAVHWKDKYNAITKLILIAPAIVRKTHNSKHFIKTPKFLTPIRNKLRDLYVIYINKVPEMKYGTKFLRGTYQNIVRVNLAEEFDKMDSSKLLIVFGQEDELTPYKLLANNLSNKKIIDSFIIINFATHDLLETHSIDIVKLIIAFSRKDIN